MISERGALQLLQKYGVPKQVVEHSRAVSERAVEIARRINAHGKAEVDVEKVCITGLLHDIGKAKTLIENGEKEGVNKRHEDEGANILEAEALGDIARMVSKHGFYFLTRRSPRLTIEEKVLVYADATVNGDKDCSLDERLARLMEAYSAGGTKEDLVLAETIRKNFYKVNELEKEIKGLMA